MRNAECGMRNCRGGPSRRLDLSFTFRIPHSAFRIFFLLLLASRAESQVDPSGSWRTLHTPHFRIHFRPAYRDAALTQAREAERSYGLLAAELHPPRGVVDITLADDIDAANGFTPVFPTNRITTFAPPPAGDHGLLFFDSWLRLVTTHELTHVFHLDRSRGLWGGLQRVFGRAPGLFPNEYQPSWVIEGLATYYESKFTNAGRVRGSFHTQLLGADRAAGASRSPWNATLFTRWADGLVPYAYGSRFFHYLAGAVGDSVVPRFAEATAAQLIPFRVGRQVARVAPGRTLGGEWPRGTAPDLPAMRGAAPAARVLDSLLRTEPVPRVSPDGRRVAYVRDDGKGTSVLRVVDAATERPLVAHRVNGGVDYDWLGDTLVVTQLDFTSRWRIRSDLYRWVPGRAWRRATRGARLVAPAAGGGRLAAIALGPASARPTGPAPDLPPGAVWQDVVPSPDLRRAAGRARGAARGWGGRGTCRGPLPRGAAAPLRPRRAVHRDRLHHVAIAASAFLDPAVRQRRTHRTVWRRAHGGNGRPGPVRLRRGPVHFAAPVPRCRRLRAGVVGAGQPDAGPVGLGVLGGPWIAAERSEFHRLRARPLCGARRVVLDASLAQAGKRAGRGGVRAHPFRHDPRHLTGRHLRGMRDPESRRRLGDAHPVAPGGRRRFDLTRERVHEVSDLSTAGRAGHHALVQRGALPAGAVCARPRPGRLRPPRAGAAAPGRRYHRAARHLVPGGWGIPAGCERLLRTDAQRYARLSDPRVRGGRAAPPPPVP